MSVPNPFAGTPGIVRAKESTDMDTNPISYLTGMPGIVCTIKNKIYYPLINNGSSSAALSARIDLRLCSFDGNDNPIFASIPRDIALDSGDPTGTRYVTDTVTSMLSADSLLFAATHRSVSTIAPWSSLSGYGGDVYSIDPNNGAVVMVGRRAPGTYATFVSTHIPYSLAWYNGKVWVGTLYRQDASTAGKVYSIRHGVDLDWALARTMAQGRAVSVLIPYNGNLYAGSWGTNTNVIEQIDSLGAVTTSLSVASGASSGFLSAVVFQGNLYVSHFKTSGLILTIRKFDGTSWSTVYTNSGGTNAAPTPAAWVAANKMYFGGGGENIKANLFTSSDGTNWTDITANLPHAIADHMGQAAIGFITTTSTL